MKHYWQQFLTPEYYQDISNFATKDSKSYFEAWYFKQEFKDGIFILIPGIFNNQGQIHAFISYILYIDQQYFFHQFDFSTEVFYANQRRLYINIDGNEFSSSGIRLSLLDPSTPILCDLKFSPFLLFHKTPLSPSIMGPDAYLANQNFNQTLVSLSHTITGNLRFGDLSIDFPKTYGYIEKFSGTKLPDDYLWVQANLNSNEVFRFSALRIEQDKLKKTKFSCFIYYQGKQYIFSSYNGAKTEILNYQLNQFHIQVYRNHWQCEIKTNDQMSPISEPKQRFLNQNIDHKLNRKIKLHFTYKNNTIFSITVEKGNYQMAGNPFI